jgi:arabinosaccharide transport system permease protein
VNDLFIKPSLRWKMAPYLFIAPFFLAFAIFGLYPTLYGLWLSLHTGINDYVFAGFQNFEMVLADELFWKSMRNGTLLTLGSLFVVLPLALGAALLINLPMVAKRKGYFATFFFTPNITSAVAVALIFGLFFNKDFGVLNALLGLLGIEAISWLSNPRWTMISLILLVTWRYLGINVLFFMAGLQNVPAELIEAAKIDGATVYQRFWHITLPLLQPIMMFIVFQAIIGSFNMFTEAYLLGGKGSGPRDSLLFPTMYLYDQAFRSQNFGYSAAIGYVFTIILIGVSLFQLKLFNYKEQGQQ